VKGESFYQGTLHKLVGFPNDRIRLRIEATLVAETDNQFDANAVSVWVSGEVSLFLRSLEPLVEQRGDSLHVQTAVRPTL
jgi:hypothetical protein